MALTPLGQSYQQTAGSFDSKLNAAVGIFQNLKASQLRKQEVAEELAQRKDLMEFEYGLRTEMQSELQEQKTEQQAQQDYIKRFNESFQDATEQVQSLTDEFSQQQNRVLANYNLGQDFEFRVGQVTDGEGNVTGAKPQIIWNGQEVSYTDYKQKILPSYGQFASDFLKPLEEGELVEPENPQQGKRYITPLQKDETITRVKTDPEFRNQLFNEWVNGAVDYEVADEGSSGRRASITKNVLPTFTSLQQELLESPEKQYTWGEDTWKPFDASAGAFTINYNSSVTGVKNQIDTAIRSGMLGGSSQFTLGSLTSQMREKMALGALTDEEINRLPQSIRDDVTLLNEASGDGTRRTIQDLVKNYNTWTNLYTSYVNDTDQAVRPDQVFLDLWGTPQDLSSEEAYQQMFKPVSPDSSPMGTRSRNNTDLLNLTQSINREVGAFSKWDR